MNLKAASVKTTVFWYVPPCSLAGAVDVSYVFVASIIKAMLLMALMMEALRFSETSVNFYHNAGRNNPEDRHLHMNPVYNFTIYV
jgi:hypothetical protein